MADSSMPRHGRDRSARGRGSRRPNRMSNGSQHDRRSSQGRSRPLPVQRRDDAYAPHPHPHPYPYPEHGEHPYPPDHPYPPPYWEPPPRHRPEDGQVRNWWHAFNKDQLLHAFQPLHCIPCGVFPPDAWAMVMHMTSIEHCDNSINSSDELAGGRGREREFRCQLCRIELRTRTYAINHFRSRRHNFVLDSLRKDLKAAGLAVPQEDGPRHERRPSGTSSRSVSTEDRPPSASRHHSENRKNPPDSSNEASASNNERIPSRNEDRGSENEKSAKKHKFFLSSEEERSDDENLDIAFEKQSSSGSKAAREPKPKVPLISAKSLVDKRKAIISKLSNFTDVRDLTKQLRQISGGRSQEKSTRKVLPGVPYSDREIEQQETFGEARAQRVQTGTGSDRVTVEIDDDSDAAPSVVKREARSSTSAQCEEVNPEECSIMPTPAKPPPETISDSDTEEQLSSTPQRPPPSLETPVDPSSSQLHLNDFGKLAVVEAQERALAEKLRYLGQTIPCIEALLSQMRQEHQNALSQIDLLRAAKNRIISSINQGPATQQAEIFNPNLILSALLQPTMPSGFANMSWTAQGSNGNLSTYLRSLGLPERSMSPGLSSNVGPPNGNCSVLGASSSANNSYAEPPSSSTVNNSVSTPATPVVSSSTNDRKRPVSRDRQSNESKRSKNCEFDEQLHGEVILVVKLHGNYVYTSSKDGVVKRTPLQDEAGSVTLYKHSAEDSNSKLSKIWANMLEVVVHKKHASFKVITGSNDCTLRVFDGTSGDLVKVVPVQARVQCGVVHWQKIYVGLKSGYIQVYNLVDQRYITESQHKQVPKLIAVNEIQNSKSIVIVTEENSVLIRDAGTLFVLHAIDRLDQEVKALMVKDDHILLCGKDKLFVFDKHAELSLTVDLTNTVFCAIPMKSGALLATTDGTLRSCKWKGIFLGNENVQNSISFTRDSRTVVTSMDGVDGTSTVALATDSGRVVVVKLTSKSC